MPPREPDPTGAVEPDPPTGTPAADSDSSSTTEDDRRNELYERAKHADYEIPRLQAMPMAALLEVARDAGLAASGATKQELIFQILKRKVTKQGLGWGEGTLDILPDGFGFLRSSRYDYRAGPDDIYVSPSQIRRLGLEQGHQLAGPVRPPKDGEKYFALLHVEAVNDTPAGELRARVPFEHLTPLLPNQRFRLERPQTDVDANGQIDMRLVDLLAPIGRGQRTLVSSPPHSSRTELLSNLARTILANHEDVYVILAMLDERPEEVTEIIRSTGPDERREVLASTFDQPPAQHVALAEMALAKAQRMVECGRDVVILLDSLTQLTRAYNTEVPHSGKIIRAGLDQAALLPPKRLFGAARRTEEGGTLTVIASILTDTDSPLDDAIYEEFRGKSNADIVLDGEIAATHTYPALDVHKTGTRREDNLCDRDTLLTLRNLRKELTDMDRMTALEYLLERLRATADNAEFLRSR